MSEHYDLLRGKHRAGCRCIPCVEARFQVERDALRAEVERLRETLAHQVQAYEIASSGYQRQKDRIEQLEQALREAHDGLAALALWRDHSEAGCNACDARAYNYDPVQHDTRCAYLTIRAVLHPDQRETTEAKPCPWCSYPNEPQTP